MESEVLPRQWLQIVEVRRTPPERALGEEVMGAGRGRGRRKRERRRPFTLVQSLARSSPNGALDHRRSSVNRRLL